MLSISHYFFVRKNPKGLGGYPQQAVNPEFGNIIDKLKTIGKMIVEQTRKVNEDLYGYKKD